tara:strand:- start:129 stop:788 length:660 start_codon:yes stop_codon:yes gene_type:complete
MDKASPEMIWGKALAKNVAENGVLNPPPPAPIGQWPSTKPQKKPSPMLVLISIFMFVVPLPLSVVLTEFDTPSYEERRIEQQSEEQQEQFRISYPQIIDNEEIEGEDYDIYRWNTANRSSLSDLNEYAELQFSMVRSAHAGYHFSLICDAFYECGNDVQFAGKQWIQIEVHPYTWTLHTDWGNSSTFFVYIEEGEDMLLAVHEDVEVNNWASVYIEVRG